MRTFLLALSCFASFAACSGPKNALRDIDNMADLQTFTPNAIPEPADLEGVWLDSGGTALMWAKVVDGEYRFFIQDSLPSGIVDPETLMAAVDDGKRARQLATEWPYAGAIGDDKNGGLSTVVVAKLVPGEKGGASGLAGTWAFAHFCHGQPGRGANHEALIAASKTAKGLQSLFVRQWYGPNATKMPDGTDPNLAYQRSYQFAKLAEPMKASIAQELADTKNFCRAE